MKKFLSIILSILMVVTMLPMSVLPASAASTPTPYDGVPVTPQKISSSNYAKLGLTSSNWSQFNGYYAIRNAKELYGFAAVSRNSYTANAVLLQDIVVNANGSTTYDWTPIISSNPGYIYESIFDGNGHYISGLYSTVAIAASGGNNAKFGGFICRLGGTAKNLVIKNSTFAPCEDISTYGGVGAITGYPVSCTIQNCRVENITLKSINDGGQLGGIAGYGNGNSSTIKNCVSINVTFSGGIYTNSIAPKAPYSSCYTSATASHNCTNLSVEHKEVKATCEYPGLSNYKYCLVCGKVTSGTKTETPATGHTLKSATCIAPKTCTICGATEGSIDNTAHSWANNDGICANGCGATCAHKNQTGSACEICGAELHVCSNYDNGFCTECDAYEPAELKDGYYQIKNGGNLFWYANYINTVDRTANAVLTADIDLENRPWTPIGSTGENSNNFRGIFDGQYYNIKGLYVEGDRAGLGFFGEVRTGTVKNFTIFGEVVVNTEVDYVGGVIGSICGVNGENDLERNGAIIQNITSYVNLTAKAHGVGKIGGFVGYANHESLIEHCAWYGTFDAGKYRVDNGAGGFIGRIQENSSEVTIRNCGAYGTIKTNYAGDYNDTATIYMGGFLSFSNTNAQTTLENCLFAGRFERGENLTDQAFLGAFGTLRSVKAIKNCYYLGDDGLEAVHSDSNLKPGSDNVEITKATEEQLKSGEIAYKLQEANEIWGQSIGTDAYPSFTGGTVYQVENCKGELGYSNTNENIGHQWVNGTCTVCDLVCGHSGGTTKPTDNGNGTHSFTCGDCGATVSDNHSGGTATCKTQAVCEVCGTSYGELDPDNHDFGSGNTCICGAEIAFTGIVVDDENSDEYRYDETRKTYTIIIPADEVGGIGYLSYDIIGTNLTLIEDTNTLLKVQHENEDGLTSAPDNLLVDVLQDNGYFGWSVLGYGDGEWEKLLYSNDGGMTWTTYTFEVKQAYSITVNASQNGTVTANEYAIEGDNIALNVSPAEGYMLDTLSVTDASGNSVDVENNAFTMPASAVTVTATFAVCDHKDGRHETATDNGDGTHDATYSCCGAAITEVPHTLDITTGKCSACGADMTAIATVTDSTNTYYAADAATLNQAVTAILETGSRTFTVELPADTEAEMITAIRRAICDTEGVADGSINLTLKGVTSIPGTTNWDGVAFGPRNAQWDENNVEIVSHEEVTQLASVNLPDATEIGAQAFYFCENLVAVSAPKAQTIGAQAFGYTALTSVEFPELTTIPTDMFSGTWTLSSAKFPKVTTIEQNGLLIGAKFNPENNPTPFPLELTAEGDITFIGSNHFNIASRNYSGKVDLVLNIDKKDQVTFNDDGTATWQVRDDLSYTFKSITFTCTDGTTNHSYTYTDNGDGTHDKECLFCDYVEVDNEAHTGGTATCTEQAKCQHCGASYGEVNAHDWSNLDGVCANGCGEVCPHEKYTDGVCDKCGYECPHAWGEGVLTRPERVTTTDWDDGYYTYTCGICGSTKQETVKRADYSAYDAVYDDYYALIMNSSVLDSAKNELKDALDSIYQQNADAMSGDRIESEQAEVDKVVAEIEKIVADAEEKIASGEYVKADYTSIDNDIYELEYKLENKMITDEGKSGFEEIKKQLNEMKADENTSKADLAELEKALDEYEAEIDKGIEDGTLVKFDGEKVFSDYEREVGEALIEKYGADFFYNFINKVLGEKFYTEYDKIYSEACALTGGTMAENAENIAQIKALVDGLYGKVVNCLAGTHNYGEGVLTRPTFESEGYYTYTCTLCGHSYTESVNRADSTALNDASTKVTKYIDNDTLTQEARDEIYKSYRDILENNGNVFDEFGFVRGDLVEEDQPAIDAITEELQKIIDDADEKIASGEYVKAEYTEIDEAIDDIEEKLASENVTDEGKAELEEIKKQLEEMKADENTSAADVAELEKALEDYEEELDKGIEDGTLVEIDFNKIADEADKKWKERFEAEGLLDEYEDFINNQKATDEAMATVDEINDFANSLEGTVAENAENIAKLNEMLDSLYSSFENCLRGTHNFKDYEITSPAKCEVNAKETSTCWFCGETDEREVEGSALEHSFTKYEEAEAPKCGVEGKEVAYCDNGCQTTDERETPALEHIFLDYTSNGDATCTADGTKTASCIHGCGETDTVADEGSKLDHTDEDGDKLCDDCGEEVYDRCDICGGKAHGDDKIQLLFCMIITIIRFVTSILKSIN